MLDINDLEKQIFEETRKKTNALFNTVGSAIGITSQDKASVMQNKELPPNKNWFGLSKSELLGHYQSMYKLGFQRKSFYMVKFTPYKNNYTRLSQLVTNKKMPWLATEVSSPILQIDTESKKVGHYNVNYATGSQLSEISISLIETKANDVLNALKNIKSLICNPDGTMAVPAEYCMWLDLWLFDNQNGVNTPIYSDRFLCYPTQASLDLSASDSSPLIVPITFAQAMPIM